MAAEINTDPYTGPCFSKGNRLARALWGVVYALLFRTSPRPFHAWRAWLLQVFGARLGEHCHVYPRAIIWAPWNLECGDKVGVADGAEIYNPSPIRIGDQATISQGAYLCGASHDYRQAHFPLVSQPIIVEKQAWIAARAIVAMGVTISEGCVIGAGSVVTKNMPPWTVCAGSPCRVLKSYARSGGGGGSESQATGASPGRLHAATSTGVDS